MNILEEIIETKKQEVKTLKKNYSLSSFSDYEFFHKENKDLFSALEHREYISIISEVKKASPSKGIFIDNFNHFDIIDFYLNNGTDALSIITDQNFFQGKITFLSDAARISEKPILRKDFVIDEYQIFESKAFGADAVLLIAEALSANQIKELTHAAKELALDVLLEIHNESEISKIDFELNKIIGINNRNLSDFSVDIKTTGILRAKIPDDVIIVSESGINTSDDISYLKYNQVNAVLVGEYFIKNLSPDKFKEFLDWCRK